MIRKLYQTITQMIGRAQEPEEQQATHEVKKTAFEQALEHIHAPDPRRMVQGIIDLYQVRDQSEADLHYANHDLKEAVIKTIDDTLSQAQQDVFQRVLTANAPKAERAYILASTKPQVWGEKSLERRLIFYEHNTVLARSFQGPVPILELGVVVDKYSKMHRLPCDQEGHTESEKWQIAKERVQKHYGFEKSLKMREMGYDETANQAYDIRKNIQSLQREREDSNTDLASVIEKTIEQNERELSSLQQKMEEISEQGEIWYQQQMIEAQTQMQSVEALDRGIMSRSLDKETYKALRRDARKLYKGCRWIQ